MKPPKKEKMEFTTRAGRFTPEEIEVMDKAAKSLGWSSAQLIQVSAIRFSKKVNEELMGVDVLHYLELDD
jgi:hypothetical protein